MASEELIAVPKKDKKRLTAVPKSEVKAAPTLNAVPKAKASHGQRGDKNALGRQALAIFPDFITGIPVLAGLAGAGIETLGRKVTTDDDIVTAFEKSMSSGFDKDLIELGQKGRTLTNEVFNIREPENTGEMLARNALMAIPNPFSFASKGATLAANLMTPLVKVVPKAGTKAATLVGKGAGSTLKAVAKDPKAFVTKGNVGRLGTQFGLGLAIDQAARALGDLPTIYSDLTGTPPEGERELVAKPKNPLVATPNHLANMHRKLKDQETEITAKKTTLGIAIALGTIAALAWRKKRINLNNLPSEFAPMGQGVTPEGFHQSAGSYIHDTFVDSSSHLRAVLRDVVDPTTGQRIIPEEHADQLVDAATGDSVGKARRIGIDGKLPGTDTTPALKIPSLRELAIRTFELSAGRKKIFFKGMVARRELVQRIRSTMASTAKELPEDAKAQRLADPSRAESTTAAADQFLKDRNIDLLEVGLYDNAFPGAVHRSAARSNELVRAAAEAIEADPVLKALMKDFGDVTDGLLQFAVNRKVLTPELKATWQREFTLYGSTIYIPGRQLNVADIGKWYERLGASMGLGTSKQVEMQGMSQWMSGLADPGTGIRNPLNHVDAFNEYLYHVIDHTDRAVAQWNIYSQLTGVDDLGNFRAGHPGSRSVEFLGIHDPVGPDAGNLKKAITSKDPAMRKLFNLEDKTSFLARDSANMDKVAFVQRNGKEYMFYVHDPAFKMYMDFKPRVLSNFNKIGRFFKNVFTATTTRLPFFTPFSFGYVTQQGWQNAVARGAKFTPFDAFKGAWAGASEGIADEIAVQIGHSLRTETGLSHAFPNVAKALEARMKEVVKKSLLHGVETHQGTTLSSIAASERSPNILNMTKQLAPMYQDGFSGLSSLWRMYNIINLSIHEGAASGAILRSLKEISNPTPSQVRHAGRSGKTLVGDVRRLGSSNFATTFQSWVPFSGAMIQSWNSVGSALRHAMRENPTRALAAVSLPMIPAIMEAVNNSLQGPEWNEYYWNTLSTEQRVNNIIIKLHGLPPERAILIPVSPEWTLARGIGIEMVDAITGASRGEHMPSGQAQENGAHFMAGLVRVFDIPVPPPIQAIFASLGYNLRMGPQYHNNQVQFPLSVQKLTQGERISGDRGRSRYVDPAVDTEIEGIVRALGGAVGSTFLSILEAFRQGSSESLGLGLEMGLDQLAASVRGQTRYLSGLYSGVLHPNSNNELADTVRVKQDGVTKLSEAFDTLKTRGLVISPDVPLLLEGNAVQPTDDPVVRIAGQTLPAVQYAITQYQKWIGYQRGLQQSLRSGTRTLQGERLTVDERARRVDEHSLTINALNAKQIMMFRFFEDKISDAISEQLNLKDGYEFSFDDYRMRPNLGEGLIVKAPLKSPQTSQ